MAMVVFIAVLLVVASGMSFESGSMTKVGSAVFQRQCDSMCSKVSGWSDWFDSVDAARQACSANVQCIGVLDHSTNRGKVGLCLRGSMFTRGSDEHEPFRRVCVEHKGDAAAVGPVNLLQVNDESASEAESASFTRQCDMMCDETYAGFTRLDAARKACAISSECAAVVDHSGNKGLFGLCSTSEALFRGSEQHEAFRAVCLERKRAFMDDNVNLLQVSLADSPAMSANEALSVSFQRHCDLMCDKVSDWFQSLAAAQQSCKSRVDCTSVVDHSANQGMFGLCSEGATFVRGSDKSPTYRPVCTEHKMPPVTPGSLLQTSTAETSATIATSASMFRRECDMVCDKVSNWFDILAVAQEFCASFSGCAGVVDHSANKGKFGVCAIGSRFRRGSDQHATYGVVCVDRKLSP